jgi:hypothetical protein
LPPPPLPPVTGELFPPPAPPPVVETKAPKLEDAPLFAAVLAPPPTVIVYAVSVTDKPLAVITPPAPPPPPPLPRPLPPPAATKYSTTDPSVGSEPNLLTVKEPEPLNLAILKLPDSVTVAPDATASMYGDAPPILATTPCKIPAIR